MVHEVIIDPLQQVSSVYWGTVFFVFGCIVGSFLNVCIHRLPREESIVSPPSHCPNCNWKIPWYFNIPIISWIVLRGKCYNCGVKISPRYLIVEALTGLLFLASWIKYGSSYPLLALIYSLFIAGLIAASFIDFEHYIIPDEITLGGIGLGILLSIFYPPLHGVDSAAKSFLNSLIGVATGAGLIFLIVQTGKLIFGRYKVKLDDHTRMVFTDENLVILKTKKDIDQPAETPQDIPPQSEDWLHDPFRETPQVRESIPYSEIFSRQSDCIIFHAKTLELHDRCFWNVDVKLSPKSLKIGKDEFNPETISFMEVTTDKIILPREAMGFGDVKYMAAIGAFLGWKGVLFSLCASSIIGALIGFVLLGITGNRSTKIPYGPFISIAALIWIFFGEDIIRLWLF
jgi:leader peptidase (prepilin peptidase)/N-methyltransferase